MPICARRRLARIAWFFGALPVAIAATLTGPKMVSDAEGCAGMGNTYSNGDGWYSLSGSDDNAMPANGVFVLSGLIHAISNEVAVSAVDLTIADASGTKLAGTLTITEDVWKSNADDERGAAVVWHPEAPLSVGADYTAHWSVKDPYAHGFADYTVGAAKLHVVGSTFGPVAPLVTQATFTDSIVWSGQVVSCLDNCGHTLNFLDTAKRYPAIQLKAKPGANSNSTYELIELVAVNGEGSPIGPPSRALTTANYGVSSDYSLKQAFSDSLAKYCVRITTTDLRTGIKLDFQHVCVDAQNQTSSGDPSGISVCDVPPSPGTTWLWCESNKYAPICADAGATIDSSPGSGGAGGDPDASTSKLDASAGGRTAGGAANSGGAPSAKSTGSSDDRGCACSVPTRRSARIELLLACLAPLAGVGAISRRQRRPR